MWELIQANKRKSVILFSGMAVCLVALGYAIGTFVSPADGGLTGMIVAFAVWIVLSLISFYSGDSILLGASHATEVSHDVHPQLFNIVEEMRIAANLPASPKIYIVDEPAPNAFATGRNPQNSSIAVTAGLLSRLDRDELQGVIAHEMSHIINRDILFVTCAGVMLGSITLIAEVFLRSSRYSVFSGRRYRASSSARGAGQAQIIIILIAVLIAILAPILARLFYFALSRKREYLADANGARLTRYPEGLASALEKIATSDMPLDAANQVTAPMYIVNPMLQDKMNFVGLFATHPPTSERIAILRSMTHGVTLQAYQKAFSAAKSGASAIIPPSGLGSVEEIPIRPPLPEAKKKPIEKQEKKEEVRNVGDLMRAVNGFAFLNCSCGIRIKIPPDFKQPKIICPRCWRDLAVPGLASEKIENREAPPAAPQVYERQTDNWETIACSCGKRLQLSPLFCGTHLICKDCGSEIQIKNPAATIEKQGTGIF